MGPKVKAAINFLESGGKRVVITSIDRAVDAIQTERGTIIVPEMS
jgi:carbamate kinase